MSAGRGRGDLIRRLLHQSTESGSEGRSSDSPARATRSLDITAGRNILIPSDESISPAESLRPVGRAKLLAMARARASEMEKDPGIFSNTEGEGSSKEQKKMVSPVRMHFHLFEVSFCMFFFMIFRYVHVVVGLFSLVWHSNNKRRRVARK